MTAKQIRKELALIIKEKHKNCITEKQKNAAVNEARKEINKKYGHGWRESYTYADWWQESNLDGSFAYNGVTDDF